MRCEEGAGAVSAFPWARKSEKQAGWIRDLSLGAGKVNPATAMFFVFFWGIKDGEDENYCGGSENESAVCCLSAILTCFIIFEGVRRGNWICSDLNSVYESGGDDKESTNVMCISERAFDDNKTPRNITKHSYQYSFHCSN